MSQYYRDVLLTEFVPQNLGLGALPTAFATFKGDKQAQELPQSRQLSMPFQDIYFLSPACPTCQSQDYDARLRGFANDEHRQIVKRRWGE